MTLRIELFQIWLKEMNYFFFKNDSKNFFQKKKNLKEFFFNISQRIDFNMTQRIESFLSFWRKELKTFSSNMTQRIENFFFEYDAKNWTLFLWIWRKELNLLLWMRRKELNLFLFLKELSLWLKELNLFSLNMTQRIESFFEKNQRIEPLLFNNMTQRIELFMKGLIELNLFLWTSSQYDSKSWSLFLSMTPRVELFFFQYDSKNWIFSSIWHKELCVFDYMTQRIEPLFEYDSKNWIIFWVWLKENRTLFFLKKSSMNRTHFLKMTQRNEPFGWKKSSNNWTFFFDMTQRIEPRFLEIWLKELNSFS